MPGPDIHEHRILILDFGAQYTQLIARRVRELGVYCEIHPWDMSDADVRAFRARGIILSGGPESVTAATPPKAPDAVYTLDVPLLGICYGMQTMAQQLGGRVAGGHGGEFGYAEVSVDAPSRLLAGIGDRERDGRAGSAGCMDESRRSQQALPAWLQGRRQQLQRAVRGHGR